jgi:hypothetical protein
MTEDKKFKRRVRDRMSKTGESYTAARSQVVQKRDRNRAARKRLSAADDIVSDDSLKEATGKTWKEWIAILDEWGARDRKHGEIARFVNEEHGVPGWWSQTVTVGYERATGLRLKYQRPDGFSITGSKTVAVPVRVLFHAFVDDDERKKWFVAGTMSLRTSKRNHTARFDWEDGSSRVVAWFEDKGPSKSSIALAHERLPDAGEAETMKAMWKKELAELKSYLESK